jgi:putative endonuclease
MTDQTWYVYMLKCGDDTLYTGITTDLERRVTEHKEGKLGARYTRVRLPVTLVYYEKHVDRSAASRREWEIKQLRRPAKIELTREFDECRK